MEPLQCYVCCHVAELQLWKTAGGKAGWIKAALPVLVLSCVGDARLPAVAQSLKALIVALSL